MFAEIYPLILATVASTSLSVLVFHRRRTPWPSPPRESARSGTFPKRALAGLIVFSEPGYTGWPRKFETDEADLVRNGSDFIIQSAIVVAGSWTLYDEANQQGNPISLTKHGGIDATGEFPNPAGWGGAGSFHVKSIRKG
jgi:hypothetical protein